MGHHHRMYRYYIQEDIMHGFMPIHLKTEKAQKKKRMWIILYLLKSNSY